MKDLEGRRFVVTGGARGIGLAIARELGRQGAVPVVTDVDDERLASVAVKLAAAGVPAETERLDVTEPEDVAAARHRILERGPIDGLVNNAGIVFGGGFLETALDRHQRTFEVNVHGIVNVTHALLPDLIARPEAALVQIASASGFLGLPYGSSYAASKWAVIGLSESLRLELGLEGNEHVQVTTVCPSYVSTGLFDGARSPRFTRMLTPEYLARRVVRGIRKRKSWVLEPWLVRTTPIFKALLPQPLFDALSWSLGVTSSMRHWRGRETER